MLTRAALDDYNSVFPLHSHPRELPGRMDSLLRKIVYLLPALPLLALMLACGDQYRPVANPIIGQGGQPQTTHYAFVLNNNPAGNSSTVRLDVSGNTNLETQAVGGGAVKEAILSNTTGALFIANSLSDSVSEFSTITTNGPITTINVPLGSRPIALTTAETGYMFVLNSSPNVNCPNTGSISTIGTSTLAVLSTGCVGVNPVAFSQLFDGTKIFVANAGDNTVSVFDPSTGTVISTITQADGLGLNPAYVLTSADSAYVFVINKGDGTNPGTLNVIASSDDKVHATLPLGISPDFAYLDFNLNRLYVTNSGSNSVTVFDAASVNLTNNPVMPTLATVNVGSGPVGVTALADGTKFYTANSLSNDVTVVSATSFGVLKTVPVGQGPVWIASEPTSTKIYTANKNSGTVSVIQTVNDTLVTSMAVPPQDPNCSSSCALQQPTMILTF